MKHNEVNIKRNNGGFAVPDGYFEEMKSQVMQKTFPQRRRIITLNNAYLKYAAIFIVGLLVAGGWFFIDQTQDTSEWYAEAVETELYNYEYALLNEYAEEGNESDLTNAEDSYLIDSEYGSEILMSGE